MTNPMSFTDFVSQFRFNPGFAGHIACERECFVTNPEGAIVPRAARVLVHLAMRYSDLVDNFSHELSACQIEFKSGPCKDTTELAQKLCELESALDNALRDLGLSKRWLEVAPEDMPLDVFPDPKRRYQRLEKRCQKRGCGPPAGSRARTSTSACLTRKPPYSYTNNRLIQHVAHLTRLGDNSNGERLALYRVVAPSCDPVAYASWENFYTHALTQGFANNPRNCWAVVRLTAHGTIEVRVFGVPKDLTELAAWAKEVQGLC